MRTHFAMIALLSLAIPCATSAVQASESDGQAAAGFAGTMLDDPDQWTLQVSRWSRLVVTVTVTQGEFEDLVLDGPGSCKEKNLGAGEILPPDGEPLTFRVDCGRLPYGRYPVNLGVGFGMAGGRVEFAGARMAQ